MDQEVLKDLLVRLSQGKTTVEETLERLKMLPFEDLGFACILVHDACATRDLVFGEKTVSAADVHASFMAALGSAYARVVTCKEFLSGAV